MHIALVLMKYNPHGGYERQAALLARALVARGHQVSILSSRWQEESDTAIRWIRIPIIRLASWLRVWSFARNVQKALQQHAGEFDQVIAFDRSLGMDIYRAGNACHKEWLRVRRLQGGLRNRVSMMVNPLNAVINRLEKGIFARLEQRKGTIVVLSAQGARQIRQYYPVSEDRFVVIPPAIDFERFAQDHGEEYRRDQRKVLGVKPDEIVLLFVGSGFRIKGLDKLLHALAILRERQMPVRLFVVGNDRKGIARYQPLVQQLGLNEIVRFTGGVDNVGAYYAAADVFVMLSLLETFNVAVVEALSFGLPVVVSEGAGVSDLITSEDLGVRLAVDVAAGQVADSIAHCLSREAAARQNGSLHVLQEARSMLARQCELDTVVGQYLEVIEQRHAE